MTEERIYFFREHLMSVIDAISLQVVVIIFNSSGFNRYHVLKMLQKMVGVQSAMARSYDQGFSCLYLVSIRIINLYQTGN